MQEPRMQRLFEYQQKSVQCMWFRANYQKSSEKDQRRKRSTIALFGERYRCRILGKEKIGYQSHAQKGEALH
jgi:hypothetical protein